MNIQHPRGSGAAGLAVSVVLLSRVGAGRLPRGGLVITGKETARWYVFPDWRQSETLRNPHLKLSLVCWRCTDAGCGFFSPCPRLDQVPGPCRPCTHAGAQPSVFWLTQHMCPPAPVKCCFWPGSSPQTSSPGACANSAALEMRWGPKARA